MDETTYGDLLRILEVYKEQELRARPRDETGLWKPTPLHVLAGEIRALDIMLSRESKRHEGRVLLPGPGDGRRGACLNRLGYDVFGVEIIPNLVRTSNYLKEFLAQQGLVDRDRIKIVEGDFLDDGAYHSNGLRFEDFSRVFTYPYPKKEDFRGLVDKIERMSPPGTELFVLHPVELGIPEIGLEHVRTATIKSDIITPHYDLSRYRKK